MAGICLQLLPVTNLQHLLRLLLLCLAGGPLAAQTTVAPPTAESEESPPAKIEAAVFTKANWIVDLGAFYANVDSKIRVDGNAGNFGSDLDFESDLGLSENELLFNASATYTGWEKWSMGIEWFQLNRGSMGTLRKDIEWGQTLLPAQADIETYFDVNILRIYGGYELWRNDRTGVGLGAGIHGAGMKAGIDAVFSLGGGTFGEFSDDVSTGAILPLPNFGIWANHLFSPRLLGSFRVDAFALEIDEYKGELWSMAASVRYKATKRLSVGAGYSYFLLNVKMERNRWNGEAEFSYHGPKLFVFYAW